MIIFNCYHLSINETSHLDKRDILKNKQTFQYYLVDLPLAAVSEKKSMGVW